ncbi:MAG: LOG family protein [Ignavibacteriae bacterium]|nr:LOG family protein [Ignavibacteriota bacterium]
MAPTKFTTKSYKNLDFLNSPDARPIRLLSEYFEPLQRLRKNQIQDTIVFFGSARLVSREHAEERKAELLQAMNTPGSRGGSKRLIEELQKVETLLKQARYYDDAVELSRLLSKWALGLPKKGRFVITSGGGPGIMEAANRGAQLAGAKSVGLNISLPFEQEPNPYIPPELNLEFHYFFMRKFWFVYPAKALVVFPGGFGTLDELFETLTLVQTDKLRKQVFVLLYGSDFWKKILNFEGLLEAGLISKEDLSLFEFADTPKQAFNFLKKKLTDRYL